MTITTTSTRTTNDVNREHWSLHIQQWEESKLSQQAYCKRASINLNSFTYWRGKFLLSASSVAKSKFVRVKTAVNHAATVDAPRSIQIKLLTGHVVYIPVNLAVSEIAKLINLLGEPNA